MKKLSQFIIYTNDRFEDGSLNKSIERFSEKNIFSLHAGARKVTPHAQSNDKFSEKISARAFDCHSRAHRVKGCPSVLT